MRFRWLDLGALPALACLTESLWLSVAAALVARVSWPLILGGTLLIMAVPAAAAVTGRAARLSARLERAIVGAAAVAGSAALIGLQAHTSLGRTTGLALADVLFVALASWLGLRVGQLSVGVDEALGRAARALLLMFLTLLFARLAHQPFAAAGVAVTAVVLAGGLLVALARFGESLAMVDRRYSVSGWTWLAGILTVMAAILLLAAILAAVTHGVPFTWTLSAIFDGLRYLLHAFAYVAAAIGYGLLRALSWVLALFHVHRPGWLRGSKVPAFHATRFPPLKSHAGGGSTLLRDIAWPLLAALVGGGILTLLVYGVHRVKASDSREPREERESLLSAPDLLGSARRRLRHLAARLPRRQAAPSSPAEAVRREFALLERSLAALGEIRHPSQTARQYLLRAGARHAAPPDGHTAMAVSPGNDDTRERLIRGYEAARYSQHALSWQDAADFRSLAQSCLERARAVSAQEVRCDRRAKVRCSPPLSRGAVSVTLRARAAAGHAEQGGGSGSPPLARALRLRKPPPAAPRPAPRTDAGAGGRAHSAATSSFRRRGASPPAPARCAARRRRAAPRRRVRCRTRR